MPESTTTKTSRKRNSEAISEERAQYSATLGMAAHNARMEAEHVKLSIDTYGLSGPNTAGMAIRPPADRQVTLFREKPKGKKQFVALYSRHQLDRWAHYGWEEIPGMFFTTGRDVPESWMDSGDIDDAQHGGVSIGINPPSSSSATTSSSSVPSMLPSSSCDVTVPVGVATTQTIQPGDTTVSATGEVQAESDGWWGRWNKNKTVQEFVVYYECDIQPYIARYSTTKISKDQLRRVTSYYTAVKAAMQADENFSGSRPFKVAEWQQTKGK